MDSDKLAADIEEALKNTGITLIKTSSKHYQEVNLALMYALIENHGLEGVYITVNKPYHAIRTLMEEEGIDTSRVFFIDAISKETNTKVGEEQDNVMFVDSPGDLSKISIMMDTVVDAMPEGEKFVLFDSMSVLSIYSKEKSVEQFVHSFTESMREWNVAGVVISIENEISGDLVSHLTQYADHVIEV